MRLLKYYGKAKSLKAEQTMDIFKHGKINENLPTKKLTKGILIWN